MGTVTCVLTLDYVARILDEDVESLEAIVSNDDNLTYGTIIRVYIDPDEAITALTDHGVEELTDLLSEALSQPRPGTSSSMTSSTIPNSPPASRYWYRGDNRAVTDGGIEKGFHSLVDLLA
ncbi:hypothetical protein ACM61V_15995 [Sphingomonas sp. TX0543]|jgi:hypothetical protein|uniref:hypothetical protein n=1 Tax=unclassified Sphingomonas TaxID=196159 RepID=UPI0037F1ACB7